MGDVNGDGRADIVTGCQSRNAGAAGSGSVVVLTRNATNTDFDAGIELSHPTPAANDSCGASMAMGDVNGDGRADIAMGCTNDDTGAADAGSVVVLARNAATWIHRMGRGGVIAGHCHSRDRGGVGCAALAPPNRGIRRRLTLAALGAVGVSGGG
jgi:hypothetical protein